MDTLEKEKVIDLIDIERVMQLIPHRYPFLMIDKVVNVVPSVQATGIKNVSINEFFFQGHFPDHPVMPGVLIIEAMAQDRRRSGRSHARPRCGRQARLFHVDRRGTVQKARRSGRYIAGGCGETAQSRQRLEVPW